MSHTRKTNWPWRRSATISGGLALVMLAACAEPERSKAQTDNRSRAKPGSASRVDRPVTRRAMTPPRRPPRRRAPPRPSPSCAVLERGPEKERRPPAVLIADPTGNLDHFLGALHDLASGRKGRRKVRVAFYGDSNATMDHAASALRRFLGKRFGHGGHGYVSAGKAVAWYQHREIRVVNSRGWYVYSIASPKAKRKLTSHAGHVALGKRVGAFAQFASAKSGSPADEVFSSVDVFYVCYPFGGKLGVEVDGVLARTVDTRCKKQRLFSRLHMKVPLGRHKVRIKVITTRVAALGAAFENDSRGIVIDGLGVGALNVNTLRRPPEKLYNAGLKARRYDLVILHTGTNMWGPGFHPGWAKTVIDRIRRALGPKISILLLSPPAFGRWKKGFIEGHPRMKACAREKAEISQANRVAFWDYFKSMGGQHSPAKLRKSGHIQGDLVHLKPHYHKIMMERFGRAIMEQFRAYLRKRKVNCPKK